MQNLAMHIVAGKYYRRPIVYNPDNHEIRPTKAIVRQGLFNAIGYQIIDANVLDLFAGTGALGVEALSRGAKSATFVDLSPKAIAFIKANTSFVEEDYKIIPQNYLAFLSSCPKSTYDVLFLDPPYHLDNVEILQQLMKAEIMKEKAIIVLETDKPLILTLDNSKIKTYKYGLTHLTIIWRNI